MPEVTLESLAVRVAEIERQLAVMNGVVPPTTDWRSVVGISKRSEFTAIWEAEMKAFRDAEQKALDEGIVE